MIIPLLSPCLCGSHVEAMAHKNGWMTGFLVVILPCSTSNFRKVTVPGFAACLTWKYECPHTRSEDTTVDHLITCQWDARWCGSFLRSSIDLDKLQKIIHQTKKNIVRQCLLQTISYSDVAMWGRYSLDRYTYDKYSIIWQPKKDRNV